MSDSKDDVAHVFDQTNGVMEDSADEAGGAADARSAGTAVPSDEPRTDEPRQEEYRAEETRADETRADEPRDRPWTADSPRDESDHTFAVDSNGSATEADESGAPDRAPGDGVDGRGESPAQPVDDSSHTGRIADAYETGPSDEARGDFATEHAQPESGTGPAQDTEPYEIDGEPGRGDSAGSVQTDEAEAYDRPADGSTGTAEAYERGPAAEVGGDGGGLAALAGDDSIGHVFDQTNGVIDGLEGDSDGTVDSDRSSAAERDDVHPGDGGAAVSDPGHSSEADEEHGLTVEDAGSTTDPADLTDDDEVRGSGDGAAD